MEQENKSMLLKKCYLIILIIILLLGITYAIFNYLKLGDKVSKVKTGTLVIAIDDTNSDAINLKNAYPMSDDAGKLTNPYRFKVTNSGTIAANYNLKLISDQDAISKCGCDKNNTLAKSIKYEYKKNRNSSQTTSPISFLTTKENWKETSLETGRIEPGETIYYEIRLWIDEEATSKEANKHLHTKIEVEAVQYTENIE